MQGAYHVDAIPQKNPSKEGWRAREVCKMECSSIKYIIPPIDNDESQGKHTIYVCHRV